MKELYLAEKDLYSKLNNLSDKNNYVDVLPGSSDIIDEDGSPGNTSNSKKREKPSKPRTKFPADAKYDSDFLGPPKTNARKRARTTDSLNENDDNILNNNNTDNNNADNNNADNNYNSNDNNDNSDNNDNNSTENNNMEIDNQNVNQKYTKNSVLPLAGVVESRTGNNYLQSLTIIIIYIFSPSR